MFDAPGMRRKTDEKMPSGAGWAKSPVGAGDGGSIVYFDATERPNVAGRSVARPACQIGRFARRKNRRPSSDVQSA
jgi:hypothetical protein